MSGSSVVCGQDLKVDTVSAVAEGRAGSSGQQKGKTLGLVFPEQLEKSKWSSDFRGRQTGTQGDFLVFLCIALSNLLIAHIIKHGLEGQSAQMKT